MGILSGLLGGALGLLGNHMDQSAQRDAAKNSIAWRVGDAQRAGVSPLFALGAPTMQFSSNVGGIGAAAGSEIGSGLESMGQDISRARSVGMDAPERAASGLMLKLQLERGGLENELLRRQISQISAPGSPGHEPIPIIPGQAPRDPDATPIKIIAPGGAEFETSASSPANTIEQQYGDLVQNAYGTGRLVYDSVSNFERYARRRDYSLRPPPVNSAYPRYGGVRR